MAGVRRSVGRAAAVAVAGAIVLSSASAASADPATDGFWYFDIYGVQAAHDQGFTGKGITIAVLDTQINLDVPTLQGADIEVQDAACYEKDGTLIPAESSDITADHATNIVSYLVGTGAGYPGQTGVKGIVPDAKIIFTNVGRSVGDGTAYCYGAEEGEDSLAMANGIQAAIDADADIISASTLGTGDAPQIVALAQALHQGIPVIASVSNDLLSETVGLFPGTANGVVGVQSMDSSLNLQGDTPESSFDDRVDRNTDVVGAGVGIVWQGDGTWEKQKYARGTSLATPIVAGLLALVAEKYPDATGNQLVQTLINNTGKEDHPLEYDTEQRYGYGVASLEHMLRVDPTKYEDVNPLIFDDKRQVPTAAQIANPPTLAEYEGVTDDPSNSDDPPAAGSDGLPVLPIVLGIVGVLVVIGIIILIVVLASRRSRATTSPPGGGRA